MGQWNVSRRTVLGITVKGAAVTAVAAGSTLGLSGCGTTDWYPYEVSPDVFALRSLIAEKERIATQYERALSDGVGPTALLERFLEHHLTHLDALLAALPEGVGPQTSEHGEDTASPEAEPEPVEPSNEPLDTTGLRLLEAAAASARLDQAAAVTDPGLAQLVSAIGACEAGHAHLFNGL